MTGALCAECWCCLPTKRLRPSEVRDEKVNKTKFKTEEFEMLLAELEEAKAGELTEEEKRKFQLFLRSRLAEPTSRAPAANAATPE